MFKLVMKSNACATMVKLIDVNPLMCFLRIHSTSRLLVCFFLEYFKLVETSMVQLIGSVEDEPCFNSLAFCKSKLHNRLKTNLGLVVKMFSQKFFTL
jgi:hypothetical protein